MSAKTNNFDVIIIGGGPAGMSAAITCAELGIDAILLEREPELGGQLLWTYNAIENYPLFRAKNGRELRDHFLRRVESSGVNYLTNALVEHADLKQKIITLQNGDQYSANSIIIATGVRRRLLNVPGEQEFRGKGILESGVKDKEQVRGKTVLIVGGGDAAVENACILSEVADRVVLIHRRERFTAQNRFVELAGSRQNIEKIFNSTVLRIWGDTCVRTVEIHNMVTNKESAIEVDAVLIRIGVVPNSELFLGQIAKEERETANQIDSPSTSVSAICVVGDVASPIELTVANAVRMGVEAAKRTKI